MTRIIFIIILGVHGLIHVMGFVKAYNIAEIKELTLQVSKSMGIIWLITFTLFSAALIQYSLKNEFWWITATAGILVSQLLIITFWKDAKFGTVPNVIILFVAVIACAQLSFNRMVSGEIETMFSRITHHESSTITNEMITRLPEPVQRWITHSGLAGRENIHAVRLKQKALMKMKPEQEKWTEAYAEQYFTVNKPAFVWKVGMKMMPLVELSGRDKYIDGKGEMLIKIFSLIPVVNSSGNEKINMGTLQRYLAEIVWFPSAAFSRYITWEEIDKNSAQATMTYMGTSGSGVFNFDEKGDFIKFSTRRYMGDGDEAQLREWIITVHEHKAMNGIRIPVKMDITWKLESGDWTWLKLEIIDIEYNKSAEWN